jgi:hypothetical protein
MFKTNNDTMFSREEITEHSTIYTVYSYGMHFPMYIAETGADNVTRWYANVDKYSHTTTRHQSHANPHVPCVPMTTEQMKAIARGGLIALVTCQ